MLSLKRNKRKIYFALYEGKTPVSYIDEWGNPVETGEWEIQYGNPIEIFNNYSAAKGEADIAVFGSDLQYDRVIYFGKPPAPVDEQSILWIDTLPVIKPDGSTITQWDYIVVRVADSLNESLVAVRRVSVSPKWGVLFCLNTLPKQEFMRYQWIDTDIWDDNAVWID